MKRLLLVGMLICCGFSSPTVHIPVVSLAELRQRIAHPTNDTTYIVNFWATWCKPCIEELPVFEQLTQESNTSNLKVLLVSLDFKKDIETKVLPFVTKRGLRSEVLLMNEPNAAAWIDKVDSSWSGAIPATIIINPVRRSRRFIEGQLTKPELDSLIALVHKP